MTKRDFELIAAGFAEAERALELDGVATHPEHLADAVRSLEMEALRIAAAGIVRRITAENPRFNEHTFIAACFPLAAERKKLRARLLLADAGE